MHDLVQIILLATVSLIIIIKLFLKLGQRTDAPIFGPMHNKPLQIKAVESQINKQLPPELQLKFLDKSFNKAQFDKQIIEMHKAVMEAYAAGDTHKLSKMLDIGMMRKFAYEISKRDEKGHACEINVLKASDINITSVDVQSIGFKYIVAVKVELDVEMINFVTNNGKIVSGHKSKVEQKKEVWTFKRDFRDLNPKWVLTDIENLFV